MKVVFDTNILIDYLNGVDKARLEIERYNKKHISSITWMEVMAGILPNEEEAVRRFLFNFKLVDIDLEISEIAVKIRRNSGIKLPDAIIWATAKKTDALLISRNSKDFPSSDPSIRVPYVL